jgi:V8-like Glu-specific endopeptidase
MNDFTDTVSSGSSNTATAVEQFTSNTSYVSNKMPSSPRAQAPAKHGPPATSNKLMKGEVMGDASVPTSTGFESSGSSDPYAEVGSAGGGESTGDTAEASAEGLASAASNSNARADLPSEYVRAESGAEAGSDSEFLAEVGEAYAPAGNHEFLPLLAAAIPTLISTVGPSLAKAVMTKVSPTVKRVITNVAQQAPKVLPKVLPKGAMPNGAGALLAQLMRLLQQQSGKESGEEFGGAEGSVDEALAAEVAQAMEVIIGNDDRVRITATSNQHWRRVCALRITFPNGAVYRGTGFFIGKRTVATAGHCVYLANQGGWARSVEVIPGMNDSTRPFGTATSSNLRSVAGWTQQGKPECDYGCIVLPEGSFGGVNLGAFGFGALSAQALVAQPAILGGYPGDKPFAQLWGMSRTIKTVNPSTLVYDIDTVGGQSGAPVYVIRNNQRCVVGIHNYGAQAGNSATRITPQVYNVLNTWSAL